MFYEYSRFTGQQAKWEAISLYPFYHFHPFHRHLGNSWVIAAESSHLRIAGSRNQTRNIWYTLFRFTLSALALVAAVIRRMLTTWVTLGNISLVLLNLFKRLIFAMFKDSSPLPMFQCFFFSSPIYAASHLNFCSLALSVFVCVIICILSWEEFIYGTFEDCIGFFNCHYCSFYFRISIR